MAFGCQTLGCGGRAHCRAAQPGVLVCDDGLGGGVGSGDAITEFFVAVGRFDEGVPVSGRQCGGMGGGRGCAGSLNVVGKLGQPGGGGVVAELCRGLQKPDLPRGSVKLGVPVSQRRV